MPRSAVAPQQPFTNAEREAVYRAIFERRDVRRNFLPLPIPDEVLARLLNAAHHAGSVGFMQPWDFVIVRGRETKRAVKQLFNKTNEAAALKYNTRRADLYKSLKLEGIEESSVNLCVTCSRQPRSVRVPIKIQARLESSRPSERARTRHRSAG